MTGKFELHFYNVRSLGANFFSVYAHLCIHRPSVLAVCKTQVCEDADPMDFHMSGYTFLSAFFPHRGLAIYIRNDIMYQCLMVKIQCPDTHCAFLLRI